MGQRIADIAAGRGDPGVGGVGEMAERLTIAQEEASAKPATVVRGVLVTPAGADRLHAKYEFLYMLALPGRGVHLDPDAVVQLLGSRHLQVHRRHDEGEALVTRADADGPSWRLCCTGPHRGAGLVLQLLGNGDVAGDTRLDLEQAAEMLALDEVDDEEDRNACEAA